MPGSVLDLDANAARRLFNDVMIRDDGRSARRIRLDDDAGACAAPRRYVHDAWTDARGDRLEALLPGRRTRRRGRPGRGARRWGRGRLRGRRADRGRAVKRGGRWRPCRGGSPRRVGRPRGFDGGRRHGRQPGRCGRVRCVDDLRRPRRSGSGGTERGRRRFPAEVDECGEYADDGGGPEPFPSAAAGRAAARSGSPVACAGVRSAPGVARSAARAPACGLALRSRALRLALPRLLECDDASSVAKGALGARADALGPDEHSARL